MYHKTNYLMVYNSVVFTTLTITTSIGFHNISITSEIRPLTQWESFSRFSSCQLLVIAYLFCLCKFAYSEYFV